MTFATAWINVELFTTVPWSLITHPVPLLHTSEFVWDEGTGNVTLLPSLLDSGGRGAATAVMVGDGLHLNLLEVAAAEGPNPPKTLIGRFLVESVTCMRVRHGCGCVCE